MTSLTASFGILVEQKLTIVDAKYVTVITQKSETTPHIPMQQGVLQNWVHTEKNETRTKTSFDTIQNKEASFSYFDK